MVSVTETSYAVNAGMVKQTAGHRMPLVSSFVVWLVIWLVGRIVGWLVGRLSV
jgi:hypothetical protein